MKLSHLVASYVTFKKSTGCRFNTEAGMLKAFCRALGDIDVKDIKPDDVLAYLAGKGPVTTFWHQKFKVLNGFYRFAISRGHVSSSPLPTELPKRPEGLVPYIYTTAELRRLLAATDILESKKSPLRAATFRALLLVLYGAALRISEALSLTLADVDLREKLLTVRMSKFYKTRLVPIGPRLAAELAAYANRRQQFPCPAGQDSAFFSARRGTAMERGHIRLTFRKLCNHAGIRREDGARYQPRLHDLRHSAAVNRLVAWYREGADIQRLLPLLATFLGHKDLVATQRYLTMTPDLLQEANRRFERYALSEGNHV
ncbi:MAG: tyrosine-type recombinase/integrase [bacterium]